MKTTASGGTNEFKPNPALASAGSEQKSPTGTNAMNWVALRRLRGDRRSDRLFLQFSTPSARFIQTKICWRSRTAQAVNLIALYKALGGGWHKFPQP